MCRDLGAKWTINLDNLSYLILKLIKTLKNLTLVLRLQYRTSLVVQGLRLYASSARARVPSWFRVAQHGKKIKEEAGKVMPLQLQAQKP